MDEIEIIRNCQKGKLQDFGLLYDAYVKKIYDFTYYKVMHKETAEDLVSLTFAKALGKIGQFDPGKGSFNGWLYEIARNNVRDHFRRKKEDLSIEDIYGLSSDEDVLADSANKHLFEEVRKYLVRLTPAQREILTMRLWDGMAFGEIAGALGLTEANCKMAFYRTMAKLRQDLAFLAVYLISILI